MNTTERTIVQSIYPALRYEDAKRAIAWLKSAFGFEEREVYEGDRDIIAHAELRLAGNLIMLGSVKDDAYGRSPKSLGGTSSGIYIAFETPAEVEACFARAQTAGAEIVRQLGDTDYGSREFGARDLEGHAWSFGTYRPQA